MFFNEFFIALLLISLPFLFGPLRKWIGFIVVSLLILSLYFFAINFLMTTEEHLAYNNDLDDEYTLTQQKEQFRENLRQELIIQVQAENPAHAQADIELYVDENFNQFYPEYMLDSLYQAANPVLPETKPGFFEKVNQIRFSTILLLVLVITIIGTAMAFLFEMLFRATNTSGKENFIDGRLFFKYGERIKADVVPIGISPSHKSYLNIGDLINKLYDEISQGLDHKFLGDPSYRREELFVNDSAFKRDGRRFIGLHFDTVRSSGLHCFINISSIGKQLIIYTMYHLKFKTRWYFLPLFIVTAPLHYWFWIYFYINNKFSIHSFLGKSFFNNAYDLIDLESYLKTSSFSVMWSIEEFAKDNGLITEELKQLIINNINNTQNISIKKSSGVRIGRASITSQK